MRRQSTSPLPWFDPDDKSSDLVVNAPKKCLIIILKNSNKKCSGQKQIFFMLFFSFFCRLLHSLVHKSALFLTCRSRCYQNIHHGDEFILVIELRQPACRHQKENGDGFDMDW